MSVELGHLSGILRFRSFIAESVRREFALRYTNSALGPIWMILQPIAQITIFTLVFSKIMRPGTPAGGGPFDYGIFLCAGIITWGFFAETTTRCMTMFLDNANLLKKQMFPRLALPVIVLGSSAGSLAILLTILTVFLIALGKFPGLPYLALFPVLLLHAMLAIAIGIIIGTLNIFFRDVGYFYSMLLQFWFWLTPIVYPLSIIPEQVQPLIRANPLTPFALSYQAILSSGQWPDWSLFIYPALLTLALIVFAQKLFKRATYDIVDEL